ncbi:LPS export ABC transporter permease LptG [Vibrio penaeicida]|uniref:LPS export ABC transporter permease LptG n=1 Tax=Vibrio penaeicida TaxID=104609 RepID=A0AAV5NL18_9VIBR|nr:LPS export ABC transporter permease LptG [Vibrio penaeicida]RTZ23851.1 lipopolysaccharide ABC transporter permease LptG [Vibrio penaeicida]GLQ71351.1 LPS export ABC transporter permease LptG [Vibrio penaeicida]
MFKILDWYIGRTIISTTALTLTTLVGLSAIIKYVEQLRAVGEGSYDALLAFYYVMLALPRDVELFFPMAVLLGALIGLGMLAASSELVVMQASGYSKLDIGFSVLKTAIPIMVIVMMLGEWGAPATQKMARELRTFAVSGGNIVSVRSGVWAKDGGNFIYVGRVNGEQLQGVNVWFFDEDKKLAHTMFAKEANYASDRTWEVKDVVKTSFDNDVEISKEKIALQSWTTTLTPDKLAVVTVQPEELPLTELWSYVTYLKDSEQDASRYDLAFWRKATQPISVGVMMFVAMSFVFGPLRSVTMGARILSGVIAGFGFYIFAETFSNVSLLYKLPAPVGALVPSIVFMSIAILLMRRKV